MNPIDKSWIEDKKKRPITNGAIPSWKVSQYIIFKTKYIIDTSIDKMPIIKPTEIANFKGAWDDVIKPNNPISNNVKKLFFVTPPNLFSGTYSTISLVKLVSKIINLKYGLLLLLQF